MKLGNFGEFLVQILSLFLSKFSPKHIKRTFDSSLLSTTKRLSSCTLSPLLGLRTLDLRLKGCRCSFLATIYTLCFILLYNMLYCIS